MSEHAVFSEDMREIVESFVVETQDILDELNEDLLNLERAQDPSLVDKVFRAVHTVKGTSSFLGLDQLNTLSHHFEEVLNRLRKGEISFESGMMDVLFEAFDNMSALLQQVLDGRITPLPLDDLFAQLKSISEASSAGDGAVGEPSLAQTVVNVPSARHTPTRATASRSERRGGSIRIDIECLDDLMAMVGQLTMSRDAMARLLDDLETAYGPMAQVSDLHSQTDRIGSLASEIRSTILTTRMVSVDRIFSKFPRVARDLGRSLDKDIQVVCSGTDTQIDRSLADDIGEALLHLIRNAIDHGIEPRSERLDRGKPPEGTISLEARHVGRYVEISVEDDGRGLDPDSILRKAVAKGRITPEEAALRQENEIVDLIWEPGFSTTDVANQVSGRGVGMDVVKTTVSRAGGSISVQSSPGSGARFTLSLPRSGAESS